MRRATELVLALGAWVAVTAASAPAPRRAAARARPAATVAEPSRARASQASRTLEDIHIEGEIPVPQVLFITARDQRRLMEFRHRSYWRTSRKLGEDTVFPSWIVVTGASPTLERRNDDE